MSQSARNEPEDAMDVHRGRCHCGAVEIEAEGTLEGLVYCNCSYCARAGYIHWNVPPERFRLIRGESELTTYQFGTRTSENRFCRTCGISPFRKSRSDPDQVDVNVRCLEGVDPESFPVETFDGIHWEDAMRER
jgi:hypothetical protein